VGAWKNAAEERVGGFKIISMFGRQHYNEILMALGGSHFGENSEVNLWKAGSTVP